MTSGAYDDLVQTIVAGLVRPRPTDAAVPLVDATAQIDGDADVATGWQLTTGFLGALAGRSKVDDISPPVDADEGWREVASFLADGVTAVRADLADRADVDPAFAEALRAAADLLEDPPADLTSTALAERTWAVLFPEGVGVLGREQEREAELRHRRTVQVEGPADQPVTDPATELLLTANALLTTPLPGRDEDLADVDDDVLAAARAAADEPQRYFYDHPIPVGVEPEANEILYGLTHLDDAIGFEIARGTVPEGTRLPCVLSVSVTHRGLRDVAHDYVADVIDRSGGLRHLDVHVFSEDLTTRLVDEVLAPAARDLLDRDDTDTLDVVGVDGRYGRHYSFLKAVAPLWGLLVDPQVRATFKIDLDQVFPQQVLVDVTGRSALEHLAPRLWGSRGQTSGGEPIELGMLAGALVNERDIATSLYTPDVPFPDGPSGPPDHVFFSKLPQALSTAAEMGTRYDAGDPDGIDAVVERIHVTGGTTGARNDALRRHRPFTPSFVARAEDQAFVLATYPKPGPRLAYLHADGLIMRHDKEAFAGEAIKAAAIGKLIGDHVRILLFSAYTAALGDIDGIKGVIDPFTGGFVSRTPVATTYLRFAFQAAALLRGAQPHQGVEFLRDGARQLTETLAFVAGEPSELAATLAREREGWELFYDVLDALEAALERGDEGAQRLAAAARAIVADAAIGDEA